MKNKKYTFYLLIAIGVFILIIINNSNKDDELTKTEDPVAQYELGCKYLFGSLVEVDLKKATYWFRKSADQGHLLSQIYLADCYYNGDGVTKDLDQALFWYQKAANQGDRRSKEKILKYSKKDTSFTKIEELQKEVEKMLSAIEEKERIKQKIYDVCLDTINKSEMKISNAREAYANFNPLLKNTEELQKWEKSITDIENGLSEIDKFWRGVAPYIEKDSDEAMLYIKESAENVYGILEDADKLSSKISNHLKSKDASIDKSINLGLKLIKELLKE